MSPDPFHRGPRASLRDLLHSREAAAIQIDLAHTYAIAGWGKDEVASMLVFLACHCKAFGQGNVHQNLDNAFGDYKEWCRENKKTTTITEFTFSELKITSWPG